MPLWSFKIAMTSWHAFNLVVTSFFNIFFEETARSGSTPRYTGERESVCVCVLSVCAQRKFKIKLHDKISF